MHARWGRAAVAVLLAAGAGAGCRSAGPRTPTAATGPRVDTAAPLVGQMRIYRHRGDDARASVKRQDLRSLSGDCDVVVEVRQARVERGTATLALEMLGRPRVARRGARQERCGNDQPQLTLNVSGVDASSAAALESALADVLQTPEAYLRAHSVTFDLPPSSAPQEPPGEHVLTRKPERLLWVDAIQHDPRGRVHHEGEVEFTAVVGADGRLREPRLTTGLSESQERGVLRVMPLWRFQPARRGDAVVAARVTDRLVFRIY
jgi:hypothetical protein